MRGTHHHRYKDGCRVAINDETERFRGPFNYLGSCGTLKERHRHERRNYGLPRLNGRPVGETARKIAIGKGDANLKEQVCPSF